MNEECPNCGQITNASDLRLVKDSCGHTKCRMCLLYEEQGCRTCRNLPQTSGSLVELTNNNRADTKSSIATEEIILPLELVINKNSKCFYKDTFSSEKDLYKLTTVNIDSEKNSIKTYIPKIELYNISTDVQMHLNNDNDSISQPTVTFNDISTSVETRANIREIKSKSKLIELVDKEPSKEKHLKSSNRSHISTIPGSPEKYKCNVCNKIFQNKKGKCYHDACVTGVKPYQCTFCDRSFVKRSHFEYHERVHSGYKPYKCNICGKAFPQQNKLNRHMHSHNGAKQFGCSKCKKRYCKQEDLRNHLNVHNNSITYTCTVCKKAFCILTNLKRHMRTHTDERPYICDQCSKSFKDKSLLIRHKRTHQKDRPFSCAHCNRVFLSKSELRRHLTVHSEDKPFSCKHCQTVFRRKDNLNRHIRHHHTETSAIEMNKLLNITENTNNKRALKSKQVSTKHKQKGKKKPLMIDVMYKSPNKVLIGVTNSHEQINSRLDSMGNITPVIRTTTELSNAVPVINGPICIRKPEDKTENNKKTFTYTEPIPLAEAVVINRRIEEKLYPQNMSRHNYFMCDYLSHSEKQQQAIAPSSMRVNPSMKSNYSNLNDLSSESTTGSETFTCQTAESSNVNLEKDSIIQHKMFKNKSIRYDDLKGHETTTLEKTNKVVGLKDCNLIDTEKKKQEQANCVSTIKKTYVLQEN
ncbi:PREDICTED: zinc finger protein 37-like isoform X1 [Polistes canadensis]|uniref:zinc finger protein 37-like isoform X1 n=1 Tax=Polistes canadensis TaxID=91411 RepID=UPI000718E42F|nr:PREDICTED: zinc finger protein 37-like isoform X1 [Polistes canadensis]